MKPDLSQFEGEYADKINIVRVNVRDKESNFYKQYIDLDDFQYVPHIILIDNSRKVLAKHTGAMTRAMLIQFVSSYLK